MDQFPFASIIVALAVASICVFVVRWASQNKVTGRYVTEQVRDFVTAGVIIYTLCVWVIAALATWAAR